VLLAEATVVLRALDRDRRLAVPGLLEHAEVPECVDLRRLLPGLGAGFVLLEVERMRRTGKACGWFGLLHVGSAEWRQRHRVRAHERKLVRLRFFLGEVPRAARESSRSDR